MYDCGSEIVYLEDFVLLEEWGRDLGNGHFKIIGVIRIHTLKDLKEIIELKDVSEINFSIHLCLQTIWFDLNFSIELKCCKDKRDQDCVSQALGDVFLTEIVHEFLLEFGQFFWHFYLELDNLD